MKIARTLLVTMLFVLPGTADARFFSGLKKGIQRYQAKRRLAKEQATAIAAKLTTLGIKFKRASASKPSLAPLSFGRSSSPGIDRGVDPRVFVPELAKGKYPVVRPSIADGRNAYFHGLATLGVSSKGPRAYWYSGYEGLMGHHFVRGQHKYPTAYSMVDFTSHKAPSHKRLVRILASKIRSGSLANPEGLLKQMDQQFAQHMRDRGQGATER